MYNRIRVGIRLVIVAAALVTSLSSPLRAQELSGPWIGWFDIGGTIPEDLALTDFRGSLTRGEMILDPGFQMDFGLGYRVTDWLSVGPEFGFTLNGVHSIGGWSYPNTSLGQFRMMANVRLEYPTKSHWAPFIGAGIGGSATFLNFSGHHDDYYYSDYYYYDEPDGTGCDLVLAYQAFGGLRYRLSEKASLGVEYRFVATEDLNWNVDWWSGNDFTIGTEGLRMHSVLLIFSCEF